MSSLRYNKVKNKINYEGFSERVNFFQRELKRYSPRKKIIYIARVFLIAILEHMNKKLALDDEKLSPLEDYIDCLGENCARMGMSYGKILYDKGYPVLPGSNEVHSFIMFYIGTTTTYKELINPDNWIRLDQGNHETCGKPRKEIEIQWNRNKQKIEKVIKDLTDILESEWIYPEGIETISEEELESIKKQFSMGLLYHIFNKNDCFRPRISGLSHEIFIDNEAIFYLAKKIIACKHSKKNYRLSRPYCVTKK